MNTFFDIPFLKKKYEAGKNISQIMRENINSKTNTKEIIETIYDLQAGSYIQRAENNPNFSKKINEEKIHLIRELFSAISSLLDCGCGELTATSLSYYNLLSPQTKSYFAFDISWSRIYKGRDFFQKKTGNTPQCFVADMENIPLPDNSIDLVTSSHALEINHGREEIILKELLRVSKKGIALFEPSWELSGEEQQKRMEKHGYIRGLPQIINKLGFSLAKHELLQNQVTQNNKTAVYIVLKNSDSANEAQLVDPESKTTLTSKEESFLFSKTTGRLYPVVKNIPVLRKDCSLLATHYLE